MFKKTNYSNKKLKQKISSKNTKKSMKGITLIALVITIIVLLILAGVTIATLTGNNGILTRANEAKVETEEAKEEELRKLTQAEAATHLKNEDYYDENKDKAVIPAGFAVSQEEGEQTIEDGLVVIDSDGNEFVWVPVEDINEMATATNGTDENGNQNYQGKLYNFTSTSATEITNYGQGTENYREPDIVSNHDNNDTNLNIIRNILINESSNYIDLKSFETTLQIDYNAMIKSVEKNKGFYIGRYEMSKSDNNIAQSKKNSIALTSAETSANEWYSLYAYGKTYMNIENSVESSMVWGSQYDAIMRWMQNSGIDVTDTSLLNGGSRNEDKQITGPENDSDIVKNIYDLYGGRYEWTLEASNIYYRVHRGGYYKVSQALTNRNDISPYVAVDGYSSRLSFYIK